MENCCHTQLKMGEIYIYKTHYLNKMLLLALKSTRSPFNALIDLHQHLQNDFKLSQPCTVIRETRFVLKETEVDGVRNREGRYCCQAAQVNNEHTHTHTRARDYNDEWSSQWWQQPTLNDSNTASSWQWCCGKWYSIVQSPIQKVLGGFSSSNNLS